MDKSQWYIGARNGIVLCVDGTGNRQLSGRFYHRYAEDAFLFDNTEQMLFQCEQFFETTDFPHPTTAGRTFQAPAGRKEPNQERKEKMSDEELLRNHGELGTFIISVQHRQNSSWQGRITWMERNRTLCFRSIWEMIRLIASAVGTEEEKEPSWFDEP